MKCSIIFVALAITFGRSHSQFWNPAQKAPIEKEPQEDQSQFGGYCYGAVKPVLEHLAIQQKRLESCEAKQSADTLSKIVQIEEKLEALQRQMAVQQELIKIARTAETLSKLAIDVLGEQTTTKQELDHTSNQSTDNLETLGNQSTAAQWESEKRSKSRPQRLDGFKKIGCKYYFIENKVTLSWHDALKKCHEMGAHLASLENRDEMELLRGVLNYGRTYWIDLNDLKTKGEFISATTGTKGRFFQWGGRRPDNYENTEHCIHFYTTFSDYYGMLDHPCDSKLNFICEASFESI